MTEALLIGRTPEKLSRLEPEVRDAIFEADRVDGQTFERLSFSHCTFANVSFKDARFIGCTFENCAFIECYFRLTELDTSRFLGCKFINCDFPKTAFRRCEFVYSVFRECFLPYKQLEQNLPAEANLRRVLCENLAREAEAAGDSADARQYRLQAYKAFERYLRYGVLGSDEWSRKHFPSLSARAEAAGKLLARWSNRILWGYGDRGAVLIRNAAVLVILIFPLAYYFEKDGLTDASGSVGPGSYFLLSADAFLNNTGFSGIEPTSSATRILVGLEVASGLIFLGLAITLLFRWITRR
jgi:hypothetical protein